MRHLIWISVILAAAGCESTAVETVAVYPVTGKVMYAGKPASGVQVFLLPTSAPMVPTIPANPSGKTDDSGDFQLSTYSQGDGAPEGGYQVMLVWPNDGERESDSDRLLGWYSGVHSKLTADIKAGSNTLPVFDLPAVNGPPEEVQGVPGRN